MANYSPFMRSVTVTNAITKLSTLIAAIEANFPTRIQWLTLQYDFTATGSLYIGNSAVAANNCGANLAPGGSHTIQPNLQGLILTSDVYMLSTIASAQMNVTAIPIGA